MTPDASGNLGIGTTHPTNTALTIRHPTNPKQHVELTYDDLAQLADMIEFFRTLDKQPPHTDLRELWIAHRAATVLEGESR